MASTAKLVPMRALVNLRWTESERGFIRASPVDQSSAWRSNCELIESFAAWAAARLIRRRIRLSTRTNWTTPLFSANAFISPTVRMGTFPREARIRGSRADSDSLMKRMWQAEAACASRKRRTAIGWP